MACILVVDDDPIFQSQMALYVERLGHRCLSATSLEQGVSEATANTPDVVFLDIHLPDASGLEGMDRFRHAESEPEVIIITGRGDPDSAEQAIREGAWHYLEKPPAFSAIKLTLERALEYRRHKRSQESHLVLERDAIVGNSPALKDALVQLARAARDDGNVLVTGETGTGKELFAKALHDNSTRAQGPFVVVDCTNIPDTLAESLLFGHVKGAFTGAVMDRQGMFELAHGGTLFFDEVGDMPASLQRSLLRVLQEKRFRPLGSRYESTSDFRVVSVTNREVEDMVRSGRFRRDLYYRLAQSRIHLPPLRDREGDIEALATHVVAQRCGRQEGAVKGMSREFLDVLAQHDWPGNVRELVSTVTGAVYEAGDGPVLLPHHLPRELMARHMRREVGGGRDADAPTQGPPRAPRSGPGPAMPDKAASLPDTPIRSGAFPTLQEFRDAARETMEAHYLERLVDIAGGDAATAMEFSGLSRARLYQLLKKHGLRLRKGRA